MRRVGREDYEALVERSPAMIWRAGRDARGDYFNAAWLNFTGRSLAQELDDGWIQGIHPDDLERYLAAYGERFQRRQPFEIEYRLRHSDGGYRPVLAGAAPYIDTEGSFRGFIGSCVDVGERFRRGKSLPVEDLFEMSIDNVCVAGFDGYFKRVNPSWTRTLGWTPEELMARPVLEFVHPDDQAEVLNRRTRLRQGKDMGPLINRYRCKDGSYRWFEWRSVGDVERGLVYAVARDITEQKRADEQLRASRKREESLQRQLIFADRMASMGTLAAGVAHEINNPLAYVSANIAMLLESIQEFADAEDREPWPMLREMALDAREGAERIRSIVNGLKTFSRADDEQLEVIEVLPLLEKSIEMTFNEIRHRARLVREFGAIPPVKADKVRLGQVFVNLLVNAAQAIPDGGAGSGEIRILTRSDEEGRAVIEVHDTGTGIPAVLLERVFEPFYTTKPAGVGTGLGLYICHNIVTGLSGQITVSSEAGCGTSFRVVLPAAAPTHTQAAALPATAASSGRAVVLVVDDEAFIGQVLCRVLREHDVTSVTTAQDALALLEAGRQFDIIFSDIMMPGMSGMAFYEELTRRFPATAERVVFISGGAFTKSANSFLEHLPNEFLPKPFANQEVRDIVQRYIARKEAG